MGRDRDAPGERCRVRDGGGGAGPGWAEPDPPEGAWRREPRAGLRGKERVEPSASRLVELKKVPGWRR